MSLAPLLTAPEPIPTHAFAAFAAMLVGAVQFALPKGTLPHRTAGWIWVVLLGYVAASGLFIHTMRVIGPFGPIHLLSVVTLVALVQAVRAARRGDIQKHRGMMVRLYLLALLLAGAFTLWPGRIMHKVLFG